MTCTTNDGFYQLIDEIPISFTQWKTILSKLSINEQSNLSSSATIEIHRRSIRKSKKQERTTFLRKQVFDDPIVESFFASSSINLTQQDVPKILAPSTKRYLSTSKAPNNNSTNTKQTQRLNYINDSVVILKLAKNNPNDRSVSFNSSKHSMVSTITIPSAKQQLPPPPSPIGFNPILKVEGQKHRIGNHDCPVIVPSTVNLSLPVNSTDPMATSTSSHPQPSASVFTYRSAAAGGNTVRQRAIAETTSNSLLISAERYKSNLPTTTTTTIRQSRQPLTTATPLSSTYISSQQTQRNNKSRVQQEKIPNAREMYDYPDPFTNCPHDILNKLSQLTKLQLETIDWEKKKRFTKKKPLPNGTTQGKDSP